MKGCARSCITGLVGLFVTIASVFFLLTTAGAKPRDAQGPAIVAGFLATLAISFVWSVREVLQHRRLLQQAMEGTAPIDGKWAGLSGTMRSNAPVTSPISAQRVVAFKYRVEESRGSGKQQTVVLHYEGTALASPTLSTNLGTFRLMSVPEFDMDPTSIDQQQAVRNFETYRENTKFEVHSTGKERTNSLAAEWNDDDGVFRRDIQKTEVATLGECRFTEQVISQGEQVCILGLYSQSRGGIVPDPSWANQTKVIRGSGESAVARLSKRAWTYTSWALVLSTIAAVICAVTLG